MTPERSDPGSARVLAPDRPYEEGEAATATQPYGNRVRTTQ